MSWCSRTLVVRAIFSTYAAIVTMNSTYYHSPPVYGSAFADNSTEQQYHNTQSSLSSETFLCQVFPNIDRGTVSAILASTKGEVNPAYNALLAISGSNPMPSAAPPPIHSPEPVPQQAPSYQHQPPLPPSLHHTNSQQSYTAQPPPHYLSPGPQPPLHQSNSYSAPSPHVAQSPYLAPTASASGHYAPGGSNPSHQLGNASPVYPPASPNLQPMSNAPPPYVDNSNHRSILPDMSKLSLNSSHLTQSQTGLHWASCDGCNADPIKGTRWRCIACKDYDLCNDCKNANVHNHHRFETVRPGAERHGNVFCDGCKVEEKSICGIRYACKKHQDEDWCERCVSNGTACGGPYKEYRQTELGRQLEVSGCVPMPPEWLVDLRPAVATYNIQHNPPGSCWLDMATGYAWHNKPKRERQNNPVDPLFTVEITRTNGRMISKNKNSFILKNASGTKLYSYLTESDRKTNQVASEEFGPYHGKMSEISWHRNPDSDTIGFTNTKTGKEYRWTSNRPISTLNHERWDFQRNALFERRGKREVIVADWTWWDGGVDPDDCLSIRDPDIDHAMVMASLSIVFDYHWRVMHSEYARDKDDVQRTEETARLTRLGFMCYWYASDYGVDTSNGSTATGKMSTAEKLRIANQALASFNNGFSQGMAMNGGC